MSQDYRNKAARSSLKRGLDFVVAISALIILSPLMVVIAYLIRNTDGGPALFKQTRIGHNGKEFICLKFRSMVANADQVLDELLESNALAAQEWAKDHKLRNDPRVTLVGKIIRKTSLDELPQLFNVLRGEMSMIGPRPITKEEITKYGDFYRYYASVKPGISGLWQISGRNNTTYEERIHLDVTYVTNWSIWLDLKIFFLTVPAVVFSKGSY